MNAFEIAMIAWPLVGLFGNVVVQLPWPWAKTAGHVLAALGGLDVGKVRAVLRAARETEVPQ
jgi:lauroyl/myristoyl acyltransferase